MKILYRQKSSTVADGYLDILGISQYYIKEIAQKRDSALVSKREHSHTGYEIHMICEGEQTYDIGGDIYIVGGGFFLLIPPGVRHKMLNSDEGTHKYSLAFSLKNDKARPLFTSKPIPVCRKYTDYLLSLCERISAEARTGKEFSGALMECAAFELAVSVLRLSDFEERCGTCEISEENARVELAKRYINDNIEQNLSVADVAAYCYIGEKQLTRLFLASEGVAVGEYIRKKKTARIEQLLADRNLSLEEISSIMNFNNEYYFNAFFKKNYGMPPGEYRKTLMAN